MLMRFYHIILWIGILISACTTPNEPASYLKFYPAFQTTPGQGTSLQQFSEYHVYVNNFFHGAFLAGTRIPILADQPVEVQILPGIRENGISSAPMVYNLVTAWVKQPGLSPGQETLLQPVFTYKPLARFRWLEEFESSSHSLTLDLDQDSLTVCRQSEKTDTLSGHFGGIILTADHPYILVAQSLPISGIPVDGRPVYLEMHYRNDIEFRVGLQGSQGGTTPVNQLKVALRPRSAWNKIYINFTPDVQASDLPFYRVIFEAQLPDGMETGHISLDNLRLIHL